MVQSASRQNGAAQKNSPRRLFIIVLTVNSLLLVLLGALSWQSYTEWHGTAIKAVRLQELIGIIKTSDETLTMSARMASVTGDLKWEERYLNTEPQLEAAIREALETLPDTALSRSIAKTDEANIALVEMEKRAFDLVRGNRKEEAALVLFSGRYQKQKGIYNDGTLEALSYIDSYIQTSLITNQKRALVSFLVTIAVFLISLTAWVLVLGLTQQYLDQRNRKEEELRKSRGFLNSIIENLPLIVFIKDAKTLRYQLYNKAVENLLDYKRDELIGKSDYEIFPKEMAELFIKKDREALQTGSLLHIEEVRFQTAGKGERIFNTRKIPLMDKEGNPEFILGITEDITEKKRAEKEIKRLEEERVRSQRLESIGTLAGGIAHDFNNLLHGIFGYISLAKQEKDDWGNCMEMLEEAEGAMDMAINLTNQLLTFSKGGKPQKKVISLIPIMDNAIKFALSGSRVGYSLQTDEDLWNASVDEDQISQVIQNIVVNGYQSMSGSGQISVEARNVRLPGKNLPGDLPEGPYAEISISDGGTGIPEEIIDKIFDPYFTTKNMGNGLGLATSFSIIKNHRGAIKVTSVEGQGSTFRIYLPASPDTHASPETST